MNLQKQRKGVAVRLANPIIDIIEKTGLKPDSLTIIGFILALGGAVVLAYGNLLAAAVIILIASVFDMLDGALARRINKVTKRGGFLDSSLDRLSEGAILIGIIAYFYAQEMVWGVVITAIALALSQVVSYLRAKAEVYGIDKVTGIFTRPERIVVLVLGLLINQLFIAILIIAIFSAVTTAQRMRLVLKELDNR
ncbi:MAG: CDP-alcohol phosphatidyltransferase family protein [Chloroflexi bacterium]|nr:CDP-alcohol phosphatidyltransferase family protein [Chloroflexota bacterium]